LAWEWSRFRAAANKRRFAREIGQGSAAFLDQKKPVGTVDVELVSFCGEADFPELVLSMLTFINAVGAPRRWTVYSDGSLGAAQDRILQAMAFPVTLAPWDASLVRDKKTAPSLLDYAGAHALGKKYFAISRHGAAGPVVYADSDVLFYPQARQLIALIHEPQSFFLADMPDAAALDQGLADHLVNVPHQVNSGLMILQPGFLWSAGNDYIAGKQGRWGYFTEQTAVHINMLANGAKPLDPAQFVVSMRDQFAWRQSFEIEELAARHYVSLVRRLIWCAGWESHFVPRERAR
jgi:hypothetical protein